MGVVKDKVGQRYGKLVVKAFVGTRKKGKMWRSYWLCVCDCGNEKEVGGFCLHQRENSTRSCGCSYTIPNNGSALNDLHLTYKRSASDRGVTFSLPRDLFEKLIASPCHYCGRPPYALHRRVLPYTGIDRVNNDLGYTPENSIPCCKECNGAKSKMTAEQFIGLCKLVTTHQGARPYLMNAFEELGKDQAGQVLQYWMRSFGDRHPE